MPLIMLVRKPSLCKWWASLADLWAYWGGLHIYVCHPRKTPCLSRTSRDQTLGLRVILQQISFESCSWLEVCAMVLNIDKRRIAAPQSTHPQVSIYFLSTKIVFKKGSKVMVPTRRGTSSMVTPLNALQPSIIYNLDVKMLASQQMGTVVYTNLSPFNVHQVQKRQQKRVAWFTFVELCLFLASGCWPASLRKAQLQKACITINNPIPATPHQTTYTLAHKLCHNITFPEEMHLHIRHPQSFKSNSKTPQTEP